MIALSTFTGAFGLDLGLEQAGFQTAAVIESDRDACATLLYNRPSLFVSAVPRDIRSVKPDKFLAEAGFQLGLGRPLLVGEADLVAGGPPCQSFSMSGKRGGVTGDPRGSLFMEFLRLVKATQPRFFLMENVKGLLTAAVEPGASKGTALQVILDEMAQTGYGVIHGLLNTADYGVPQLRERLIFIGSRDHEPISLPAPLYNKDNRRTLRDALFGLEEASPEYERYSAIRSMYMAMLQPGQCWRDLPPEHQVAAMGGAYESQGGKTGFYRRLSWDKPAPTLTTNPNQRATDLCHPDEVRPLTVREYARVQTFPDYWQFRGSLASKYRMIGNAVPIRFARSLGAHLAALVEEDREEGIA